MGEGEKWILVSPWGDPSRWDPVRYRVVRLESSCKGALERFAKDISHKPSGGRVDEAYEYEARSPTVAIAKCIWEGKCASNVDLKVAIIASETLARQGDVCKCNQDIGSVKRSVENLIGENVEKFFGGYSRNVSVVVAPGIGLFYDRDPQRGVRWSTCNTENYTSSVFSQLLDIFEKEKPTRVIVDISHGVNYMPYLAVTAVEKAFKTYILREMLGSGSDRNGKSYSILVVNSDPYTPLPPQSRGEAESGSSIVLNVNVITCREIKEPAQLLEELLLELDSVRHEMEGKIRVYKVKKQNGAESLPNELKLYLRGALERYNEKVKKEIENVSHILKGLEYGLLLLVASKLDSIRAASDEGGFEECLMLTKYALEYIDRSAEVNCSNDILKIHRSIWINSLVLSTAVKSCITLRGLIGKLTSSLGQPLAQSTLADKLFKLNDLKSLIDYIPSRPSRELASYEVRDIKCRTCLIAFLFDCVIGREVPYEVVYDVTEEIYSLIRSKLGEEELRRVKYKCEELTESEIETIKKVIESCKETAGTDSCSKVREFEERLCTGVSVSQQCPSDERNFYAHAGFEKNVTVVRIDRGEGGKLEVLIGYKRECIKKVEEYVKEIYKKEDRKEPEKDCYKRAGSSVA